MEISKAGIEWYNITGRNPFFNYCAHKNNSSQEDVDRLKKMFDPSIWQATISVICEKNESVSKAHIRQQEFTNDFMQKMLIAGYSTRKFDPAGQDDIGGGCGQLWFVQQWVKENPNKTTKRR